MNEKYMAIDRLTFLKALSRIQTELWELGYLRWRVRHYFSTYWQTLPDGEYTLYVSQGGIRNREIPRDEKDCLKDVLKRAFGESFFGTAKIETVSGEVVIIQGYTKQ